MAIYHWINWMGGLGLTDLRTKGGIKMLKFFRHEIHGQTQVGQLLVLQVQASQLEAGIPEAILEEPDWLMLYLTPNWVLLLRQYMSNHNVWITLTQTLNLRLRGPYGRFVIDQTRLKGNSPTQQQGDINLVRIFLQVTTIFEMTADNDPSRIATWALNGIRGTHFESQDKWPQQQEPSSYQKRLWKRYISSHFLRYGMLWRQSLKGSDNASPSHAAVESPQGNEGGLSVLIKALPSSKRRLLSHVKLISTDAAVRKACRTKRPVTIASDGGLKGNKGTFGWNIRSSRNEVLIEGAGPIDGPFDVANSTRSELGGYAAALLLISLVEIWWGEKHRCKWRWVTDSQAAIANVNRVMCDNSIKKEQPNNPDYLAIIRTVAKKLRQSIKPFWVKGHQQLITGTCQWETTLMDITGNNRADDLATWYREASGQWQSREKTDHEHDAMISIKLNGVQLVSKIEECVRYHINGYHLRNYVQSKYKWTNQIWNTIDVKLMGNLHKQLDAKNQIARTK